MPPNAISSCAEVVTNETICYRQKENGYDRDQAGIEVLHQVSARQMINYASPATIVATEYHAIQQIMCLGAICWPRNRDDSKSEDTMQNLCNIYISLQIDF